MAGPELRDVGGGTVAVFSARCPGKQTPNEDAAAVIAVDAGTAVVAIADGMGGPRAGEQASEIAVRALAEALDPESCRRMTLRSAILNGFDRANREVSTLRVGAGTTLAVLEIQAGVVRPYHVGDSSILTIGQRGRVRVRTVSHSPVAFAVESGYLDEGEAMSHDDLHLVSNALGHADMRIEIGSARQLAARDTTIVCSDGLSDNLATEEIVEIIRKGRIGAAAERLAAEALDRMTRDSESGKPDDLSFVLFRLG